MTEYHYFYVFSSSAHEASITARGIANYLTRRGGEVKGPGRMASAPPDVLRALVFDGQEPLDPELNWLGYIAPDELVPFAENRDELHGYTLRFLSLHGVSISSLLSWLTVPGEVGIQMRLRTAGHLDDDAPFSYDYTDDYYTEVAGGSDDG